MIGTIFVLIIFCAITLLYLNKLLHNERFEKLVNISFSKETIMDCESTPIPCISHEQCIDSCKNGLSMRCNEGGFCDKGFVQVNNDQDCDQSKGLIEVFAAVGEFGVNKSCVSIFRDIIDDQGNLRPYICENGVMEINLENDMFDVNNCICNMNYVKYIYTQGAYSRPLPVCIPKNSSPIYDRIYRRA
uniref:Per os infectivity factor 3 n=1 Tax=Adoxophyes orana granulovirus TaxID=170617 RepID=A0A0A7V0M1_GVAO|nr:per os infectivity factor 3 [Adoxophyes orana granulovirus]